MATWLKVRSTFFALAGDTSARNLFFTDSQVVNFANKALRDIGQAALYKDVEHTEDTSAAGVYVANVYQPWRGEANTTGVSEKLQPTTKDRINSEYPGWSGVTGTIQYYYTDQMRSDSRSYIGFYPKPSGTTSVRFYFFGIPDEVSDASTATNLDIPSWCSLAIIHHMLYQAFMVEGKRFDAKKSMFFKALYDELLQSLIGRTNGKINRKCNPWQDRVNRFDLQARSNYFINGT